MPELHTNSAVVSSAERQCSAATRPARNLPSPEQAPLISDNVALNRPFSAREPPAQSCRYMVSTRSTRHSATPPLRTGRLLGKLCKIPRAFRSV